MSVIVIAALFIVFVSFILRNCRRPNKFPPGPQFLPLIGSWHEIPARGAEHLIPKWRKKYGNIIGHKIGFKYIVFVTGVEEVVTGLRHVNFQNKPNKADSVGLFFGNGKHWSEARRFTLKFLGQIANARLETVQHDEMLHLFSTIRSGEIEEINYKFTTFALMIILNVLINAKKNEYRDEIEKIQILTSQAFRSGRFTGIELMYPSLNVFYDFHMISKATESALNFCQERLKERRAVADSQPDAKIKDFIDSFLLEQKNEKISSTTDYYSDEQLMSCMIDMIQAASQSLGTTIAFLLLYVSLNPTVQDKIQQELDSTIGRKRFPKLEDRQRLPYCEATIYETMRINIVSPISLPRLITEDTEFYGYTLPKNAMLLFGYKDTFLDRNVYSDPELFKPERFLSKDVKLQPNSFGLGKRSCIGDVLSKNILFLFITYFFQRYYVKFPKGHENPSTVPDSGFAPTPKSFKLIITERS